VFFPFHGQIKHSSWLVTVTSGGGCVGEAETVELTDDVDKAVEVDGLVRYARASKT
jgi:hypothetical protein